ncbi:MAG: serine/threonine-protein kinase PknK, partial [Spirochaetota bacterium]
KRPGIKELARLRQEFEFSQSLDSNTVVHPIALQENQNQTILIMEDFGGVSLKQFLNAKAMDLPAFLQVATTLASHLASVHAAGIIHKDIKPQNILINPKTKAIRLIGFGISSRLSLKSQNLGNPDILEGTLAYISPEQTGRMNRVVDYRSDLYSLGVTFYEILTGFLPFQSQDSMELVHSHLAKTAKPMQEVDTNIPTPLSNIVERLMAKNAEERYQSAFGLKHDLEQCSKQLQEQGTITTFTLASQDHSGLFQISQKLYGREKQLDTLLQSFERVAGGSCELMLVSGYSGVGKSALIHEVHKPITTKRGNFVSGKFDQFQRNTPYYAIRQAFEDFVSLLLTESTESLEHWKNKITEAVGQNGQVLLDIIPGLEKVIGKQPVVAELGLKESQNRFNLVFQNFVRSISHQKHPLVVFIDDLQWADSASLVLFKLMMTDPDNTHLLFIGAYRDNEVDSTHPFIQSVDDIRKTQTKIHEIVLENLTKDNVSELLTDALLTSWERVEQLTELVYHKTQGNAFFTTELLKELYENEYLYFEQKIQHWVWDVQHITNLNLTDNVVELMTQKLIRLAQNTKEVIKLASCIGNKFDLKILSIIYEKDQKTTLHDMWPAVEESLLLPLDENYRLILSLEDMVSEDIKGFTFKHDIVQEAAYDLQETRVTEAREIVAPQSKFKFTHDRVQQTSYKLIEENKRQKIHLKIGRLLLENTAKEEKIFDIVNQFNNGIELLELESDKLQVSKLNLNAGIKAKKSNANGPAAEYLKKCLALLPKNSWKENYQMTLSAKQELCSVLFFNSNFIEVEKLYTEIQKNVRFALDGLQSEELFLQYLTTQGRMEEAIKEGRKFLKKQNINLPQKVSTSKIIVSLIKLRFTLWSKTFVELEKIPRITDQRIDAVIRILSRTITAVFQAEPKLYVIILSVVLRLSIRYGYNAYSAPMLASYGLALCALFGDIEQGYRFGKLSLKVNNLLGTSETFSVTGMAYMLFIQHWKEPVRNTVERALEFSNAGFQSGDVESGGYCLNAFMQHSFYSGDTIPELNRKFAKAILRLKKNNIIVAKYYVEIFGQLAANFEDVSSHKNKLIGNRFNEEKINDNLEYHLNKSGAFFFHIAKLILCFFFQEY